MATTRVDEAADEAPVSRVQRKRDRRIQEILTTAAELFGERGYDAVSLEDVAERLDVTKGSLYYYFPSKDQLGISAVETLGNRWTARLEELLAGLDGPVHDRLRGLIGEHISIAVRDYPAGLRMFLVPQDWPEQQRAVIKELRQRHDRLFRELIDEGVAAGDFTVTGVDAALRCMHASMSQSAVWFAGLEGQRLERAIAELTDTLMMLVGVMPGAGTAPDQA
ncbi:TetR/AcrR family transcriptional regulator [Actinomycetospora endophytica]|uniref:TetR/AcrR family transcriptional regulator n=1 Tax=Actinomycetospora endophytica TaxID=2291215 RepID=A0ABS8PFX2_9PSEU|nr:TetR/AcrR family transcriptional regulator [Actinomycetospora endophytica]MCD2196822.1 TetR/AcrR family transcriptional regulator [Actinomycetospora endophytica]